MSVLQTLLAAATSKAGAAVAGLTLAAGTAGAAGVLPHDLPSAFDNAFGDDTVADQGEEEAEGEQTSDEVEQTSQEIEDSQANADDQGVADEVHDQLNGDEDVWPGDEGFGQAVSENARENGSEFGQSVAEAASNGRSGEDTDEAEASQDGQEAADAGADNAVESGGESDNAETADEYRPENPPEDAGAPEDAGPPEDAGKPAGTPGR